MSVKSASEKPSPSRRRKWTIAAAVAAVALVIGFVVFKPWLLFVDVRVDEQLPIVASAPAQAQPTPPTPITSTPGTSTPGTPPSTTTTPTPTPAGPVQLAAGTLISHEHTTTGTVRIVQQPDGSRVLTLENLDTSNGPDVHVWLSAAPGGGDGRVVHGRLRGVLRPRHDQGKSGQSGVPDSRRRGPLEVPCGGPVVRSVQRVVRGCRAGHLSRRFGATP